MVLMVIYRLLLGVLDVAVTCVHELVVFPPTSRRLRESNIERECSSFLRSSTCPLLLALGREHLQALSHTENVFRCGIGAA